MSTPIDHRAERGSALLLAIFVMVILTGMGIALVGLAHNEMRMGEASLEIKEAFFLAEAGVEAARAELIAADGSVDLDASLAAAAGPNGVFDFDPSTVQAVFDEAGEVVGFTGYGDDVPILAPSALAGGRTVAFLLNDPEEMASADPRSDSNRLITIFGVGATAGRAQETVQAIVEPSPLLPSPPPCTITLLGPAPDFYGGEGECVEIPRPSRACGEGYSDDSSEDGCEDDHSGASDDSSDSADSDSDSGGNRRRGDDSSDGSDDDDSSVWEGEDELHPTTLTRRPRKTFRGDDCAAGGGFVPVVCIQECVAAPAEPVDCTGGDDSSDDSGDGHSDGSSDATCGGDGSSDSSSSSGDSDSSSSGGGGGREAPSCDGGHLVAAAITRDCPNDFVSGPYTGLETVAELGGGNPPGSVGDGLALDPGWSDCDEIRLMLAQAELLADAVCRGTCDLADADDWGGEAPTTTPTSVLFVDGDLTVGPGYDGRGLLVVTGTLAMHADAGWRGAILAVGEGRFVRSGHAGAAEIHGGTIVADIAGPDGVWNTDDDCTGGDGGFSPAMYHEAPHEAGDTGYCSDDLLLANPLVRYETVNFRQH